MKNNASPLQGGLGFGSQPEAPHRANLRSSCGAKNWMISDKYQILVVVLVAIFVGSCSSRVVYEPSNAVAASAPAININTASTDELEKLPHIGRKTAESIIEFRTQHGPFRRRESLMQIRGIGEERYLNLRHLVRTE